MGAETPRVAIGIPTYDRLHLTAILADSLHRADLGPIDRIFVIDDCSTEYSPERLSALFPAGTSIARRERNLGADHAGQDVLRRLHETGAEVLLILDSDLVVSRRFLSEGLALLAQTDGLLSLFNTPNHPTVGETDALLIKSSIGAAATLWTRARAGDVLANVPAQPKWDWRVSKYLGRSGTRICCVKRSLVQHMGFLRGQNSSPGNGDLGLGFVDDSIETLYGLLEGAMHEQQHAMKTLSARMDRLTPQGRRDEWRRRVVKILRRLQGR